MARGRTHGSTIVIWPGSVPWPRCPACSAEFSPARAARRMRSLDGVDIWPLPDLLEAPEYRPALVTVTPHASAPWLTPSHLHRGADVRPAVVHPIDSKHRYSCFTDSLNWPRFFGSSYISISNPWEPDCGPTRKWLELSPNPTVGAPVLDPTLRGALETWPTGARASAVPDGGTAGVKEWECTQLINSVWLCSLAFQTGLSRHVGSCAPFSQLPANARIDSGSR